MRNKPALNSKKNSNLLIKRGDKLNLSWKCRLSNKKLSNLLLWQRGLKSKTMSLDSLISQLTWCMSSSLRLAMTKRCNKSKSGLKSSQRRTLSIRKSVISRRWSVPLWLALRSLSKRAAKSRRVSRKDFLYHLRRVDYLPLRNLSKLRRARYLPNSPRLAQKKQNKQPVLAWRSLLQSMSNHRPRRNLNRFHRRKLAQLKSRKW